MENTALLNGQEIRYSAGAMVKAGETYCLHALCKEGDTVSFDTDIDRKGCYRLCVHHLSQGDAHANVLVDGQYYGGLHMKAEPQGGCAQSVRFFLPEGRVTITLLRNWGEVTLKGISLLFIEETPSAHAPDFALSNPYASPECHALMAYLQRIYGKRILTGQHVDAACADIAYIKYKTGQEPAMAGFDVMSYSSGTYTENLPWDVIRGLSSCSRNIDAAIRWAQEKGGLVTLCWHWYSPTKGHDRSFYTTSTDFNLAQALSEQGEDYALLIKDMDMIAEQLKRLRDLHIPVIWRPLHEADGGWFWWGASGAEAFKQLYRMMHDRFTNLHGLNNLIWVLTAVAEDWYPGDDVVDVASIDVYAPQANPGPLCIEHEKVREHEGQKPIALGEIGTLPDLDVLMQKTPFLWFMLWYGFSYDEANNKPENLVAFMNSPSAVNLKEFAGERLYGTKGGKA